MVVGHTYGMSYYHIDMMVMVLGIGLCIGIYIWFPPGASYQHMCDDICVTVMTHMCWIS